MRLCSNNQLFLQKWDEANAAIDAQCSEGLLRALTVPSLATWYVVRSSAHLSIYIMPILRSSNADLRALRTSTVHST